MTKPGTKTGTKTKIGGWRWPDMHAMTHEGLRLFFPLAAIHAALWPFLWVLQGLDLVFANAVPPSLWHGYEMVIGAFGAALLGFISTAVPEWTGAARPGGRVLFALAGLWLFGRLVGLLGAEVLIVPGALADGAWLLWMVWFILRTSFARRTTTLIGFGFWLALLAGAALWVRWGFLSGDVEASSLALRLVMYAFLGLLGLALARIVPAITNLVLDPTRETTPFRPHPGRRRLAPGLVALAFAGELAGLSPEAAAYLMIAAGAAFLDRLAEQFIGREAFRAEIIALGLAAAFSGLGLVLAGAARLGAPFAETTALHLTLMGGLGMAVLGVFSIAGLLHMARPLGLGWSARLAIVLLTAATLMRVAPGLGLIPYPPGPAHLPESLIWAAAFLLWLRGYLPMFWYERATEDSCG